MRLRELCRALLRPEPLAPAICPKCGATQPPVVARTSRPARTSLANARMNQHPEPAIAAEEVEPLADVADEDDEDTDDDADVPEIEADEDTGVDPVIVRD